MADPKSDGRMIRKDISNSDKYAALSPAAAVLFAMMIPHYNSWGKMNGGAGYIKDEICPKVTYLTYDNIPGLLEEISEKTNVKYFKHDGRNWIHSVNFLTDHQKINMKKVGRDLLPTCSGLSPDLVHHEGEVEVEVKGEVKGEGEVEARPPFKIESLVQSQKLDTTPLDSCSQSPDVPSGRVNIIAQEKSGIAYGEFRTAIDKHLDTDCKLVIPDPISVTVYLALGELAGVKDLIAKNGDNLERAFRERYERREVIDYVRGRSRGP